MIRASVILATAVASCSSGKDDAQPARSNWWCVRDVPGHAQCQRQESACKDIVKALNQGRCEAQEEAICLRWQGATTCLPSMYDCERTLTNLNLTEGTTSSVADSCFATK